MRKIWGYCTAVLGRVIFIGFGVQIVMGVLWMCNAFCRLQGFGAAIACVGKLLLSACAAAFFLQSFGLGAKKTVLFGTLAMITFPMIAQCYTAAGVSPVLASVLLALTGGIVRIGKGRKLWWQLLLTAAAGVIAALFGLSRLGPQSIGSCMASRMAWTTIYGTYEDWPQEYQDVMDYEMMKDSNFEAAGVKEIMLPYLTETVGQEEAEKFLKGIALAAWEQHAPVIVKETVWDMAGYVLPPVVVPMQLQGRAYDSYSGANYDQLLRPAPRLGKAFMDYSCWWFAAALAIAAVLTLSALRKADLRSLILAFLPGLFAALLYALSGAGQMDYKNNIYLVCVWIAVIVQAAVKCMEAAEAQA